MNGDCQSASLLTFIEDNTEYSSNADKANLFANKFSAISAKENHTKDVTSLSKFLEGTWQKQATKAKSIPHELDELFEIHELVSAIKQANNGSAPGQDNVHMNC